MSYDPRHSTCIYHLAHAQVTAQDAGNRTLTILLRDGQMLSHVPVLHYGPADGVRINQAALPGRGNVGVVALLNGDINSAVWLGAFQSALMDAVGSPTDPFLEYQSHFSGYWSSLTSSGATTQTWPDGTQVVVGTEFSPQRHIVSGTGQRVSVPFTQTERVPNPPGAFPVQLIHASGTEVEIDSSGNLTVSGVGTISITSPSTISIAATGNITINSQGTIHAQAPSIYLDDGGTTQPICLQALQTWIESHVHSGVQAGGSDTGPPVGSPPANSLTTIVHAQ